MNIFSIKSLQSKFKNIQHMSSNSIKPSLSQAYREVQHILINNCNLPHTETQEQKPQENFIRCRKKAFEKNPVFLHDKSHRKSRGHSKDNKGKI